MIALFLRNCGVVLVGNSPAFLRSRLVDRVVADALALHLLAQLPSKVNLFLSQLSGKFEPSYNHVDLTPLFLNFNDGLVARMTLLK